MPPRSYQSRRGVPVLALLAAVALSLTGCGGSDESGGGDDDPAAALATAKTMLDDTSGLQIDLATDGLPDGVSSGVEKAEGMGTAHDPAFEGTITVRIAGQSVDVPVIGVDSKVYAKIPFTGSGYTPIDPSDYGAPDPAKLLGTDAGFSALLPATTDVKVGDSVRGGTDNKEVLTEYTGTVPDTAVKNVIPSSSGDFDATYTLTDDDQLRELVLTGKFYGDDHDATTYTVGFDQYGSTPDIKAP